MDDLITPKQAGEILGVSRQLVQYYCLTDKIPSRRVGRLFLMLRKNVMQYKQSLGKANASVRPKVARTGKRTAKAARTRPAQA